jgi:DNA topoisomerase IA
VVDRYLRVKNFKPEPFWGIKVMLKRDDIKVNFLWRRVHLFDRAAVTMMLERCLAAKQAKVTKVNQKPTSKWRPLPLTTVDLQMMGSRFLRLDSQTIMKVAETLYTKGYISYPRTETDQFDKGIDLKSLVEKQLQDQGWGQYAREYGVLPFVFFTSADRLALDCSMENLERHVGAVTTTRPIHPSTPSAGSLRTNYKPMKRKSTNSWSAGFLHVVPTMPKARPARLKSNTARRCSTPTA